MEWTRTLRLQCIFCCVIVTLHVYYCANCVTHLDVCTVYTLLYLVSFLYFSGLMKVITASSKRCNKVCELFQQCMSEYRAGVPKTRFVTLLFTELSSLQRRACHGVVPHNGAISSTTVRSYSSCCIHRLSLNTCTA